MFAGRLHIATGIIKNFMMALLLCACSAAFSQPASTLYKTAAQLYKANKFDSAAADYEKILSQGYRTAEVYYYLGNCYYKLNIINKAIINYERGLKLAPQDEDIQHNLAIANTKVVDKIQVRQNRMAHATEILQLIRKYKFRCLEVPVTVSYTEYSMKKGQRIWNSINILFDLIFKPLRK